MSRALPRIPTWTAVLLLVVFAAALRFYALGEWSFAGDEVATLQETQALFGSGTPTGEPQIERLPRVIPASYLINRTGYALFGWHEWGTRVVSALAGTALVGIVALVGGLVLGRRVALVLATLVALSPAHIFQSQTNRFYSLAALFAGAAMLSGAVSLLRPGVGWLAATLAALTLSVLTHTVTAALALAIGAGIVLSRRQSAGALPQPAVALGGMATVALGAWLVIYVRPLLAGWNEGVPWAYSPLHAVMAALNMLGWPMSLLAGVGVVLMFEDRAALRWYWLCCLGAWVTTTLVLPVIAIYQPWYAFPATLSAFAFAAYAAVGIHDRLRPSRPYASVAFVGIVMALSLPSLGSYYRDGSRPDMRAAIEFVDRNWAAGDRVAAPVRTFKYYAPARQPVLPMSRAEVTAEKLEQLASAGGRLWVIIESGRGGLPTIVARWLSDNASHRLHVSRQRYDYFEYAVDVFEVTATGGNEAVSRSSTP